MAWYYVKSGGTATGDGGRVTTQRTGAWSGTTSEYYDNFQDAAGATTPYADGDFILCSHLHNASYTAGLFVNFTNPISVTSTLQIISVDNANQENYLPGASETLTDTDSVRYTVSGGSQLFAGISFAISGTSGTFVAGTALRTLKIIDGTLDGSASTTPGALILIIDGVGVELVNTDINGYLRFANGASVYWHGGTLLTTSGDIFILGGGDGGLTAIIEGVDMSAQAGSVLDAAFSATTTDVILIKFINCRLNSSLTLPADSDLTLLHHRFEMWGCDDSTGGELFRYHMQDGAGKVVNNNSKYVTAESAWYAGSTKSSYEVSTTSLCSHVLPFTFDLPIEYVDLTNTATDLIRVALTTSLTLTDTEIAAYLVYPDGTTSVQANWVTSGKTVGTGNYGIDPLGAGATLPTSSTTWTGALANKYQLDCDTSGDVGAVAPISVRIEIYRASITNTQLFITTEYEKT